MFKKIEFVKAAHNLEQLPKELLPEVIMLGRSNVGKSSFINSLFNRKNLAHVGQTPGKTRSINYYKVDNSFYMVDLPGYGYAKVSKQEREKFSQLIYGYLMSRKEVSLALHLIDSRHKPGEFDVMFNELLRETDIPYIVVLSKSDKLNQSELSASVKTVRQQFPELLEKENLIAYSAFSSRGHNEILRRLSALFVK